MADPNHTPDILRKKISKVEEMMEEIIAEKGSLDKAKKSKKYQSLQKKQMEYKDALKEVMTTGTTTTPISPMKKRTTGSFKVKSPIPNSDSAPQVPSLFASAYTSSPRKSITTTTTTPLKSPKAKVSAATSSSSSSLPLTAPPLTPSGTSHSPYVLKKKLDKVNVMLLELGDDPKSKKYKTLLKKKEEYIEQLEEQGEGGDDGGDDDKEEQAPPPAAAVSDDDEGDDIHEMEKNDSTTTTTTTSTPLSYEILNKKLEKVSSMMQDIIQEKGLTTGPKSKKYQSLEKKQNEYQVQIEQTSEWKDIQIQKKEQDSEGWKKVSAADRAKQILKDQQEKKERDAIEEAAKKKKKQQQKEQEEAEAAAKAAAAAAAAKSENSELDERRKQARMIMEQKRQAKEQAEKEAKERKEREKIEAKERKEREKVEAQERAIREAAEKEARIERERLEAIERAEREEREAKERAEREAREAKERAEREAREAEERAEQEAREAVERAQREKEEAEAAERQRIEQEKVEAAEKERRAWETANAEERAKLEKIAVEAEIQRQREQQGGSSAAATVGGPPKEEQKTLEPLGFVDRSQLTEPYSDNVKKLLREMETVDLKQKKLTKQLNQNGIPISEDIPYEVAKDKLSEITGKMQALATSTDDPKKVQYLYYQLEEEMAKYSTAIMLTDEWQEEQERLEAEWDAKVQADNIAALRNVRRHMPVLVRNMGEDELSSTTTPNGKVLPKPIARKFKRTNVLQLLRMNPVAIERMHPSLVEGLRTTGLTLTERRALYEHLKEPAAKWQSMKADPTTERKWMWHQGLKMKFKEMVNQYTKHVEQYGPPSNHPYQSRKDPAAGGCPMIGNQCPIKADKVLDYDNDYGYPPDAEYEAGEEATKSKLEGDGATTPRGGPTRSKASKSSAGSKMNDEQLLTTLKTRTNVKEPLEDVEQRLLRELFHAEKRAIMLEKQLAQAGIAVAEDDIPYNVAKEKVEELTAEIRIVAASMGTASDPKVMRNLESDYMRLSQELEKYMAAMTLTKEWAAEQRAKEQQWEDSVLADNISALQRIRRHMPVNIRDLSERRLSEQESPNGKILPKAIAKKFIRTNILMLLRMDPKAIEPMHPSSLEALRTTGLTLTERRALYEHLKALGPKWKAATSDKMLERKWMWHESLKGKFKELVTKYDDHVKQYGPPGNHPYANRKDPSAGGCPLMGIQCPVKADAAMDYSGDYGYPIHAEYTSSEVKKHNLLSVEDFQNRATSDDELSDDEPVKAAMGGLLSAISLRKG